MNLVDTPGDPGFLLPFQNILITLKNDFTTATNMESL